MENKKKVVLEPKEEETHVTPTVLTLAAGKSCLIFNVWEVQSMKYFVKDKKQFVTVKMNGGTENTIQSSQEAFNEMRKQFEQCVNIKLRLLGVQ